MLYEAKMKHRRAACAFSEEVGFYLLAFPVVPPQAESTASFFFGGGVVCLFEPWWCAGEYMISWGLGFRVVF